MAAKVSTAARSDAEAKAPPFTVAETYAMLGAVSIGLAAGFLGFYAESIIRRVGGMPFGLLGVLALLLLGIPLCILLARSLPEHGPAIMVGFIAIAGALGIGVRAIKADQHQPHRSAAPLTASGLQSYLGVDPQGCSTPARINVPHAVVLTLCHPDGPISPVGGSVFGSERAAAKALADYTAGKVYRDAHAKVIADHSWKLSGGRVGGRELLYTNQQGAWLEWTDRRHRIVASAMRADGNAIALQAWFDRRRSP